ncbi:MAG TPA: hypothetical protein VMT16_09905 [Thermoanaerobaculia bacterium]|nr:hypothetical protein [Thermoanaerobaculia bacterium]
MPDYRTLWHSCNDDPWSQGLLHPALKICSLAGSFVLGFAGATLLLGMGAHDVLAPVVSVVGTALLWGLLVAAIRYLRGAEPERRAHRRRYRLGVYILFASCSTKLVVLVGMLQLRGGGMVAVPVGAMEALTFAYHLAYLLLVIGVAWLLLGVIGGARRTMRFKTGEYPTRAAP